MATSSLGHLTCSMALLMHLLSFHQVSPSFLDLVFSFGNTFMPKDFSLMGFQCEDTLSSPEDELLQIPRLGRRGPELRLCYMLRGAERSDTDGWRIRQAAVYHSFAVATGTAFWITIKGNDVLKQRMEAVTSELPQLERRDVNSAFAASLATHLIVLE